MRSVTRPARTYMPHPPVCVSIPHHTTPGDHTPARYIKHFYCKILPQALKAYVTHPRAAAQDIGKQLVSTNTAVEQQFDGANLRQLLQD